MKHAMHRALSWGVVIALMGAGLGRAAEGEPSQFADVRKTFDEATRIIWYVPKSAPEVVKGSAFYLYFGRGDGGKLTPLRLKAIYYGDAPLDIRRYWANADGKQLISLPAGTWNRDNVRHVWEWLDAPLDNARQIHELLTLAQARNAVLYLKGKSSIRKVTLGGDEKRGLRNMIQAYQASGGSLNP
jgi:hypothetical protein